MPPSSPPAPLSGTHKGNTPSTPVFRNASSSREFNRTPQEQAAKNDELTKEMRGHFIGPMPVVEFLDRFLPYSPSSTMQALDGDNPFRDTVSSAVLGSELLMYAPFIKAAQPFTPSLSVINTSQMADSITGLKPDVSFYRRTDGQPLQPAAQPFSQLQLFAEFKAFASQDTLSDTPDGLTPGFEKKETKGHSVRGQMAAYVAAQCGTQFRTHTFSVGIFGDKARLYRWDANGVIVTQRFDYGQTRHLVGFLERFDQATPAARGCDVTITPINDSLAKEIAFDGPPTVLRELSNDDRNAREHEYFCTMVVPSDGPHDPSRSVLISYPPRYRQRSPFGRTTQSLHAYDPLVKKIVFVKQYWRVTDPQFPQEASILRELAANQVRHLPTVGGGNDIPGVETLSQEYTTMLGASSKANETFHLYRILLETNCVPLSEFRTTEELLQVVRNAMECHDDAYFHAHILHRDISASNIMIEAHTREGVLVDWDRSVRADHSAARRTQRSATWQFLSARLCEQPDARQGVADDRESAFWVLVWTLITSFQHDQTEVDDDIFQLFDDDGTHGRKLEFLQAGGIGKPDRDPAYRLRLTFASIEGDQLCQFLNKLACAFRGRYDDHHLEDGETEREGWFVEWMDMALDELDKNHLGGYGPVGEYNLCQGSTVTHTDPASTSSDDELYEIAVTEG